MSYLTKITNIIKKIRDSDKSTRDKYNYSHNSGLSLQAIKKYMYDTYRGAAPNQWVYINRALRKGVEKGTLIKTGGKYKVAVIKKKSRKLRKCKYGRDPSTGKCRKKSRKSSRKSSRKKLKFKMSTTGSYNHPEIESDMMHHITIVSYHQNTIPSGIARDMGDAGNIRREMIHNYVVDAYLYYNQLSWEEQKKYLRIVQKRNTHGGGLLHEQTGRADHAWDYTTIAAAILAYDKNIKINSNIKKSFNLWEKRLEGNSILHPSIYLKYLSNYRRRG